MIMMIMIIIIIIIRYTRINGRLTGLVTSYVETAF